MNSTDRSRADAERLVVLDELDRTGPLDERRQPKNLREVAAVVLDFSRHDFERTFDLEGAEFHRLSLND